MKIDYKKKIEKMKKELQSVQVAITEPDLIFIDYVEEGKYKIDYRFVGGSAVYFWDKLRDCIIPEGYKGMVLVDFMSDVNVQDVLAINMSELRNTNRIPLNMAVSFDNPQQIENSIPPECTIEIITWEKNENTSMYQSVMHIYRNIKESN